MGLTVTTSQQGLDLLFPTTGGTDYVAYSTNGTSESTAIARTSVGATGWAAATAADPSVKANASVLPTAAATAGATISHYAIYSASTAGTQRTDWQALDTARTVAVGDQLSWAVGALKVTLT